MATAQDYFFCVPEHRVAVCRKCCNAVWPNQAGTHLQQSHGELGLLERTAIANDLSTWSVLCKSTDPSFALPVVVEGPIPGLQLFRDGLQCQLQPGRCSFIARAQGAMDKHWRAVHDYRVGTRGGSRGPLQQQQSAQRRADALRVVCCQ